MALPKITYELDRERMERDFPAYTTLIVDAGRKDVAKNIAFRKMVREKCREDIGFRRLVMELCSRDILFFAAVFGCVQEPRGRTVKTLPFIPYGFQERLIADINDCWGVRHVIIVKSRTMGATWVVCGIIDAHKFLFSTSEGILGSSDANMVDKTGSKNTIMAKLDFVLSKLPWWMLDGYRADSSECRQNFMFRHPKTESAYVGASTTEDIGRGGRGTVIELDEFAKWKVSESNSAHASIIHTSDCAIIFSTPRGAVGAFHDQWINEDSPALKIRLHWTDHPIYRRGMYRSNADGELELIDDEFWNAEGPVHRRWKNNKEFAFTKDNYPFVLDGKVRSPWYDEMCIKCGSAVRIAQELDCDFSGSDSPFFDADTVRRKESEHAKEPLMVCNPIVDFDAGRILGIKESNNGLLSLWELPDERNEFPSYVKYAIGVDVSAGTKGAQASNSVITIFDRFTRKQVAEYVSNSVKPHRLAEIASALGHMFNTAMINWENGIHGQTFLDRLVTELHYPNLYRGREREVEGGRKLKKYPGWWPRPTSKMAAFERMAASQADDGIILLSKKAYIEQRQFVWVDPQTVEHRRALSAESPSERKGSHGDRVSAVICAIKIFDDYPVTPPADPDKPVDRRSLAFRNGLRKTRKALKDSTLTPSGVPY